MNIKKKILILLPNPFYSPLYLNNYTRTRALIDLGHEVSILTFPHGKEIIYPNLKIIRIPKKPIFKNAESGEYFKILIYSILLYFKFIFLKKNKYDFIFAYGTLYLLIWIFKPFIKPPVYATVYTNLPDELLKWGVTRKKLFYYLSQKYEIFCLKKFDKIIVQSKKQYNDYKLNGIKEEKLILINHSIITEKREISEYNDNSFSNSEFNVTYTGSFVSIQNISLIYNTASIIKNENIKFNLIGASEQEIERERMNNIVKENKDINIFRRMDPDELKSYIDKADVLVSPRVFGYDTPIKIFDYLSYGKCILATDRPIHNQVLNKNIAYLTEPKAEDFAKAILYLKDNKQIVLEYGKKALEYFERNYSFEKMKFNYKKLIEEIHG